MKNLKLYYWEKTGYHNGAAFAIAENLQEARELIVEEFKRNYLKDHFNMPLSEQQALIEHRYKNEEEFFIKETCGAYSGLLEELQEEPQIFDVTKKGFNIWASL